MVEKTNKNALIVLIIIVALAIGYFLFKSQIMSALQAQSNGSGGGSAPSFGSSGQTQPLGLSNPQTIAQASQQAPSVIITENSSPTPEILPTVPQLQASNIRTIPQTQVFQVTNPFSTETSSPFQTFTTSPINSNSSIISSVLGGGNETQTNPSPAPKTSRNLPITSNSTKLG